MRRSACNLSDFEYIMPHANHMNSLWKDRGGHTVPKPLSEHVPRGTRMETDSRACQLK